MHYPLRRLLYLICLSALSHLSLAQTPLVESNQLLFPPEQTPFGATIVLADQHGQQIAKQSATNPVTTIDITQFAGQALTDGHYKYQITPNHAFSQLSETDRETLRGESTDINEAAKLFALDPQPPSPIIGSFLVQNGHLINPNNSEE